MVNGGFVPGEIGTQVLRINSQTQISEIKQGRVDGEWAFDAGRFQFGVDSSKQTTHRIGPRKTTTPRATGAWPT